MENTMNNQRSRALILAMCLVLAVLIMGIYAQVKDFGFSNFDDTGYVAQNRHIQDGLTWEGVRWAFRFTKAGDQYYWHPLTSISHMVDIQLFGLDAGMHHLSNVAHHLVSAILLFCAFALMTGSPWKSAFLAALFAVHPVNVDSVAWIAERKNLLSSLFWMLAMVLYYWYTRRPSLARYALVAGAFILGLLSKPMIVTLPFVLLLLDYWPLGRIRLGGEGFMGTFRSVFARENIEVVIEKIPLLLITLVMVSYTMQSFSNLGVFISNETIPMGLRAENAIVSYALYMVKMLLPMDLAIYYPFPGSIAGWKVVVSFALLAAITVLAVRYVKRYPYVFVGWFWYVGTLVPVIGIKQGGLWPQMAERWAYIPYIGLFAVIAWGVPDLLRGFRRKDAFMWAAAAVVILLLTARAWDQTRYWKDDIALFRHAVDVTKNNDVAHYYYGAALMSKGDRDGALNEFKESLRINSYMYQAHVDLGILMMEMGYVDEAINHYSFALWLKPQLPMAHYNLGSAYLKKGNFRKAVERFQETIRVQPDNTKAALNLDRAREGQRMQQESISAIRKKLETDPGDPELYTKLGNIFRQREEYDEAVAHYKKALSVQPERIGTLYGLVLTYKERKEYTRALDLLNRIRELQSENPDVYYNIACISAQLSRTDDSIYWLKKAIEKGFKKLDMIRYDPDLESVRAGKGYKDLLGRK